MQLTKLDRKRLVGVHPDLVRVVERAATLTTIPFVISEGVRSYERQQEMVARGSSKTMNSRHLVSPNGYSHAADLLVKEDSTSWPLYHELAVYIKQAAEEEGVSIEWGGDWKSFKDGPHWQLPWSRYPGTTIIPVPEPMERPSDVPYEESKPKTVGSSWTIRSVLAQLMAVPAAVFAYFNQHPEIFFGAVALLVGFALFIGRERVKKIFDERT